MILFPDFSDETGHFGALNPLSDRPISSISPLLDVLEESKSHLDHLGLLFECPCSSSGAADGLQYLKAGTYLGASEFTASIWGFP